MKYKNNPLNIRATDSKWIGAIEPKNGFLQFSTLVAGVRCGLYLLLRTYKNRGWKTIEEIISHWAPPEDGNKTQSYIEFVCSYAQVQKDQVYLYLNMNKKYRVICAMALIETNFKISYKVFEDAFNKLYNY